MHLSDHLKPPRSKRDFDALERRRMEARHLFRKGIPPAQIARQLKVARQTVSRWVRQYRDGGKAALRKAGRASRLPKLNAAQLKQLKAMLAAGPESFGYPTPLWTCPRAGPQWPAPRGPCRRARRENHRRVEAQASAGH